MADNYLERKMEEHRNGAKSAVKRRLTPAGVFRRALSVPLGEITVLVVGHHSALIQAFANAGVRVRFCNEAQEDKKAGGRLAEHTASQYLPMNKEEALAHWTESPDFVIELSQDVLTVESLQAGKIRNMKIGGDGTSIMQQIASLIVLMCAPGYESLEIPSCSLSVN